mgnify:CR=1 FL=1
MTKTVGYVGVDHHHRDPYFAVASGLDVDITAVCEPGESIDVANIAAMDDRPDEITTEGQDASDLVAGATAYEDPHELVAEAGVDDAVQLLRVLDAAYDSAGRDAWVDVER